MRSLELECATTSGYRASLAAPLVLSLTLVWACANGQEDTAPAVAVGAQATAALRILNASPYAIAADEDLAEFVQVTAEAAISNDFGA